LWILRLTASATLLLASYYFFFQSLPVEQRQLFMGTAGALVLFLVFERGLINSSLTFPVQLFIQFSLDLMLVAVLVVLTGGIYSPFVFLFGLLIVAAGTQAQVLVVLLVTVFGCICYLASINGFALWQKQPISAAEGLHLLLQTSALFLVGGVMAAIARRHASLQQESHQVEYQHRRLKEMHDQVVSSMQEGIVILDEGLHIQDSNEPARRLLNTRLGQMRLQLQEIGSTPESLLEYLGGNSGKPFQCEWHTESGICLVTASELPGEDPAARWVLTLVDISELRKLERKLAEQDKLASMGRMLAMLAHEVRNPLQTIGQSVELMKTVGEGKQEEIQEIVSEEISRLNRLVSDMLDFLQPLKPEPVDVYPRDLIGSSVVQVDMVDRHRISWRSSIEELNVDPDHFRLVLDNLLRNAVEASSDPGSVEILLESTGAIWELSIQDQGGGISESMRGHLFEPFATGRTTGIGLGLATVWQVCQANDWHVEVNDIPGGSRFSVRGKMTNVQGKEMTGG